MNPYQRTIESNGALPTKGLRNKGDDNFLNLGGKKANQFTNEKNGQETLNGAI